MGVAAGDGRVGTAHHDRVAGGAHPTKPARYTNPGTALDLKICVARLPKELPDEVSAGRGYDGAAARALLRWRGVGPKIAKRGAPHGSGLGRARWVVERTISGRKGWRRMRVRYDRSAVIRDAWTSLAASAICFRILSDEVQLAA